MNSLLVLLAYGLIHSVMPGLTVAKTDNSNRVSKPRILTPEIIRIIKKDC